MNMKKINTTFALLFLSAVLIITPLTFSQSIDTTFLPSLDNHIFTSITGVDDPFINTKFKLFFGSASLVETEIPITIQGVDKTINFKPDIFYAQGGIEFQYAVKHWAALRIKAAGFASLGNNALSLFSQGVDAASTFGIGWLIKLVEEDNLLLSTSIDLNSAGLTYINFASGFDSTVSTADTVTNYQLVNNFQSLTTNLEFRFAVRLSKVIGVITKVSAGLGEVYAKNSESNFKWNTGILLSIDLRNWINIPFGVAIGGTAVSSEWRYKDAKPPIYSFNLNIAFINRNDFTVGFENYMQSFVVEQAENALNFMNSKIYMSYYF
jgi:hypothetical protein